MKSNGRVELTRTEAVERAVACSKDKDNYYGLGRGGRKPSAERPYDSKGRVDCSGFVSWALGFDRYQTDFGDDDGWWWSTDGIYEDATIGAKYHGGHFPCWFKVLPPTEEVQPGDVLVYPDYKLNGVNKQGHTGVIVAVEDRFKRGAPGWHTKLRVAHATPSHRLKYGNVVAITDAKAWAKKGWIVRYTGFVGE